MCQNGCFGGLFLVCQVMLTIYSGVVTHCVWQVAVFVPTSRVVRGAMHMWRDVFVTAGAVLVCMVPFVPPRPYNSRLTNLLVCSAVPPFTPFPHLS